MRLNPEPAAPADTRRRLIAAGLDAFGHKGFKAASTREIAAAAGANLAAIKYHFGSKQGLYLAVAQHIAEQIASKVGGVADQARAALEDGSLDRGSAAALLERIVEAAARTLVASSEAERWARVVLREQFEPTAAFEVLYSSIMRRMHLTVTRLIAVLLALDPDNEDVKLEAFALLGQVLVFRTARAAVLRRMEWKEIGQREADAVIATLKRTVRRLAASGGRS
jgi:AcrR family transcriptional regulator